MDVTGQKMSTAKYFLAIVLPDPLYSEIEKIKSELYEKYGLKGALRSPSHITLHRPFEWKLTKENELIEKLSVFEFPTNFDITIRDFNWFVPRVIFADVIKNQGLENLHEKLTSHCKKNLKLLNEDQDLRGFHPHVTVAFRDLKKPLFIELQKEFAKREIAGSFKYNGFSLLKLAKSWDVFREFKQT